MVAEVRDEKLEFNGLTCTCLSCGLCFINHQQNLCDCVVLPTQRSTSISGYL